MHNKTHHLIHAEPAVEASHHSCFRSSCSLQKLLLYRSLLLLWRLLGCTCLLIFLGCLLGCTCLLLFFWCLARSFIFLPHPIWDGYHLDIPCPFTFTSKSGIRNVPFKWCKRSCLINTIIVFCWFSKFAGLLKVSIAFAPFASHFLFVCPFFHTPSDPDHSRSACCPLLQWWVQFIS